MTDPAQRAESVKSCPWSSTAPTPQAPVTNGMKQMADDIGALGYFETSALASIGVKEVFEAAAREAFRAAREGYKPKSDKGGQAGFCCCCS